MRKQIWNMPFEITAYISLCFYALRNPLLWTSVRTQIPAIVSPFATTMLNFVVPVTSGKARCNFNHANTGTGRIASLARFARSLANIKMQTLSCGKDHKVRKGNCQLCRRWLRQDAATSFAQTLERHRSRASQGSQGTLRTQGSHSKL